MIEHLTGGHGREFGLRIGRWYLSRSRARERADPVIEWKPLAYARRHGRLVGVKELLYRRPEWINSGHQSR